MCVQDEEELDPEKKAKKEEKVPMMRNRVFCEHIASIALPQCTSYATVAPPRLVKKLRRPRRPA